MTKEAPNRTGSKTDTRIGRVKCVYRVGTHRKMDFDKVTKKFTPIPDSKRKLLMVGVELLDGEDFPKISKEDNLSNFSYIEMTDSNHEASAVTKLLLSLGQTSGNLVGLVGELVSVSGNLVSYDDGSERFFGKKMTAASSRDAKSFKDDQGQLSETAFSINNPTAGTSITDLNPFIRSIIKKSDEFEDLLKVLEAEGITKEEVLKDVRVGKSGQQAQATEAEKEALARFKTAPKAGSTAPVSDVEADDDCF